MLTPGFPEGFLRCGLDMVELDRFRRFVTKNSTRLRRIYTAEELAYCEAKRDPIPSLAVRFCVKEAAMKALGKGWPELPFTDIEVRVSPNGKPRLVLHGKAQRLAGELYLVPKDISLTHTMSIAAAVVFLAQS